MNDLPEAVSIALAAHAKILGRQQRTIEQLINAVGDQRDQLDSLANLSHPADTDQQRELNALRDVVAELRQQVARQHARLDQIERRQRLGV